MCVQNGHREYKMGKTDIWASLWQITPKVHRRVVKELTPQIGQFTTFEAIYTMVELSGITADTDILVTSRALRDIRNKKYNLFLMALYGPIG